MSSSPQVKISEKEKHPSPTLFASRRQIVMRVSSCVSRGFSPEKRAHRLSGYKWNVLLMSVRASPAYNVPSYIYYRNHGWWSLHRRLWNLYKYNIHTLYNMHYNNIISMDRVNETDSMCYVSWNIIFQKKTFRFFHYWVYKSHFKLTTFWFWKTFDLEPFRVETYNDIQCLSCIPHYKHTYIRIQFYRDVRVVHLLKDSPLIIVCATLRTKSVWLMRFYTFVYIINVCVCVCVLTTATGFTPSMRHLHNIYKIYGSYNNHKRDVCPPLDGPYFSAHCCSLLLLLLLLYTRWTCLPRKNLVHKNHWYSSYITAHSSRDRTPAVYNIIIILFILLSGEYT